MTVGITPLKRVFDDWYHGNGERRQAMLLLAECNDVKISILSQVNLQWLQKTPSIY